MERRNPEKIIVFVYTVYVIVLMFSASAIGWPMWINPVVLIGILVVWVVYMREVRDYKFRALLYSAIALGTFALYNTLENSFEGILTTYCAIVVALSILNVPEIVVSEYVFSTFLIVYHGIFKDTIPMATTHEKILSAAQIFAVFMVTAITHHLIKKRQEKDRDMWEIINELKAEEQSNLDFLAHVSRNIEQPVDNIYEISGRVLAEGVSDGAREKLMRIQAEGEQLLDTLDDLLALSALESGTMELEEAPYQPASVFRDVIGNAINYVGEKDLEVIVDCDAKIPSVLLGDAQKLRRVMLCLVSNAAKYTQTGSITIAISARPEGYGINLQVRVKDTGIGIAPEDLEKIFSVFHKLDMDGPAQEKGIGIGLAITKRIVTRMEGFINAKSELGKGSEFQFVVPQKIVDRKPMAAVRNRGNINIICYIDFEKTSFAKTRDDYLNSISHMMEGLALRHHQCRNLGEFKRRIEKEIFTHALITQDEYLEDRPYFDALSRQMEIIMIQDRGSTFVPEENITAIQKPFCAFSLSAILNGDYSMLQQDSSTAQTAVTAPSAASGTEKSEKTQHIDRTAGIRQMGGNREHYASILQVYLSEGREKLPIIQETYQSEDWKNYIIYVHAVKSNSFGIGAGTLGEMAKALELAGKEGNISYIREHHAELIRLYREVLLEIDGEEAGSADEGRELS